MKRFDYHFTIKLNRNNAHHAPTYSKCKVLEVITWTQIGYHTKPVVVLNVLNFYNPLRALIRSGIKEGFIQSHNEHLVVFVDGPSDLTEHETFDWGKAALEALDSWDGGKVQSLPFDWKKRGNLREGEAESLSAGLVKSSATH